MAAADATGDQGAGFLRHQSLGGARVSGRGVRGLRGAAYLAVLVAPRSALCLLTGCYRRPRYWMVLLDSMDASGDFSSRFSTAVGVCEWVGWDELGALVYTFYSPLTITTTVVAGAGRLDDTPARGGHLSIQWRLRVRRGVFHRAEESGDRACT